MKNQIQSSLEHRLQVFRELAQSDEKETDSLVLLLQTATLSNESERDACDQILFALDSGKIGPKSATAKLIDVLNDHSERISKQLEQLLQ